MFVQRRFFPSNVVISAHAIPASSDFESLEELTILHDENIIENIKNNLNHEIPNDYSDDLRLWIK